MKATCKVKKNVGALADEIFQIVEEDQGYAFISDGLNSIKSRKKLFATVRGALKHTEISARKIRKWLKKHGEL